MRAFRGPLRPTIHGGYSFHGLYTVEAPAPVRGHGLADEFVLGVKPQGWTFDGEELPWVGDTFERVRAAISERDARAADEVGDRA